MITHLPLSLVHNSYHPLSLFLSVSLCFLYTAPERLLLRPAADPLATWLEASSAAEDPAAVTAAAAAAAAATGVLRHRCGDRQSKVHLLSRPCGGGWFFFLARNRCRRRRRR